MTTLCPSCCNDCHVSLPVTRNGAGPFALSNFLPAGVILLDLLEDSLTCDHRHAEDGLHAFSGHTLLPHIKHRDDEVLLRWMDFLTANRFLLPTCQRNEGTLLVRVYIIPFDLTGVQGKLRARHPNTVKEAAKAWRAIMGRVVLDESLWHGRNVDRGSLVPHPILSRQTDNRTITKIYSDLPSPDLRKLYNESTRSPAGMQIHAILSGRPIESLRSALHAYQVESVAAMLEKELHTFPVPDPLYIPLTGIGGRTFYLRPGDMEILRECPTVSQACGGVLCEELGTGKTVMILALILATVDQLSQPEESILDSRPVMTPLSFRNFPFANDMETRRRLHKRSDRGLDSPGHRVPTLTELLIHHIRASPEKTGILTEEEALEQHPFWHLQQANTPFYFHFDVEIPQQHRMPRKSVDHGYRRMYLTVASLIVVPASLLGQWDTEIQKHCDTRLRVLIGRPGVAIPRASRLASDYDIVLLSHNSLSLAKADISKLYSWDVCACPTFPGTRVPDCHCDEQTEVSPLFQVRWKRLIVDEGHVSATMTTNLSQITVLLSAERRWIVTGTPTTNLLGLSFGNAGVSVSDKQVSNNPIAMEDRVTLDPYSSQPRRWTTDDREDLRKLGTMISHFLRVRHFADPSMLNKFVINPLFDVDGPLPGAIQVLTQVMEMVMIRHRIEDVEKDVVLPPLHQETVLLDLDPYALKSYNALQATIAVNAIDSQRTDQDYLFHPSNVDRLLQATENITQVMFWHTDSNLFNADELNRAAASNIKTAMSRNESPEDIKLLMEAFHHIGLAASDGTWRAMQAHPDVQYRVRNVPPNILQAWSRLLYYSPDSLASDIPEPYLQPDRLVRLRDMVADTPLASERTLIDWGRLIADEDHHKQTLHVLREKSLKSNRTRRNKKEDVVDSLALKAVDVARKERAPDKIKEVLRELEAASERLNRAREGTEDPEDDTTVAEDTVLRASPSVRASFIARSSVSRIRVGMTTSSKLNYILREVMQHSATEKFLIFSKMPLSLAYVAEGLDVIGVRYLQFTSSVDPEVRRQLVMTFQSSDKYRVFLMDLKHGARGLNLTTASRIIFCEPVWQADVESQAIKRAHRIGQTKPITVKILAIRSTSEEMMVARRDILKDDSGKVPNFVQEIGMRHFIAHPKFLKESDISHQVPLDTLLFPAAEQAPDVNLDIQPISVFQDCTEYDGHAEIMDVSTSQPEGPSKKKRKTIRFADEVNFVDHSRPRSVRFDESCDNLEEDSQWIKRIRRVMLIVRPPA